MKRRLARFSLSVAGMAAFVLLGVWVANRWILPHHVGSGTAFAMPLLEGSSKEEVYALCARRGLILSERPPEFDASLPSGYLLRQHPPAGTQVKSGRRVNVTFSAGPRMMVVPELRGQTERQARLSLEDLGLVPGDLLRCPGQVPAGEVLSSRPGPGARVPLGGSVSLLLSTGGGGDGYLMPDLRRRDLDGALTLLSGSGLEHPELRYRTALGAKPGTILAQSPAAGTRLERGRHLELVVASGSN